MVGVVLDRSTPESFAQPSRRRRRSYRFVLDCHLVAGDFDYFLKISVGDMADFNRIHGEQLIALPGVRQTHTFFVMKEVVDSAPLQVLSRAVTATSLAPGRRRRVAASQ